MFGCIRRIIGIVIVLAIIVVIYLFRDRISARFHGRDTVAAEAPSAALGDTAARKLEDLHTHRVERVALGAVELQSLVQYKYPGLLPAFAQDPHIELDGDRVKLRVRVPVDRLPDVKGLGDAAAFLPDTTEVAVSGTLLPLSGGRVALAVDAVQAARIPLPSRMISDGLKRVGRKPEPGLPKDAIGVALPPGVGSAYIRNDSLILLAQGGQ